MKKIVPPIIVTLLTVACAPTKLPPIEIRESKWCETEKCDAVLIIVDVAIDRGGRIVNGGYVDRWYMPMAVCQDEINSDMVMSYHGPINIRGYRRANTAWCEYRDGYADR